MRTDLLAEPERGSLRGEPPAGVVPLVATAATGDSAELAGGFVYLTPGFYQLGGPLDDNTSGIAVDAEGAVYVSGVTLGSLGGQNAGDFDALLVKRSTARSTQAVRICAW